MILYLSDNIVSTQNILFKIRSRFVASGPSKHILKASSRKQREKKLDGLHLNKQTKDIVLLISEHGTHFNIYTSAVWAQQYRSIFSSSEWH